MAEPDQALIERIKRFRGFLEMDADNVSLLIDLGDLEHKAGHLEEAEQLLQKALQLQPDSDKALSRLGNLMISQLRFAEAEAIFRSFLTPMAGTADPALLHNLGITLAYQDRWQEALDAFVDARNAGIQDAENPLFQAYCLINLGRTDEVEGTLIAALEGCDDDRVIGRAALLQMEYLDFKTAVKTAEQALARNPENIDASVVTSSWLMEQQEVDEAAPQITRILEVEPDNHRALLNRALVQMYNQEIPAAIETFQRVLELTPRVVGTWVALGWAYIANNDLRSAEQTFKKGLEIDRNFGETHGGLATVYALQGRLDDSRREAKLATGLNKGGFGAVYANSLVLEQKGKRDAAVRLLGGAFKRSPGPDAPTLIDAIAKYSRRQAARQDKQLPPPK